MFLLMCLLEIFIIIIVFLLDYQESEFGIRVADKLYIIIENGNKIRESLLKFGIRVGQDF